MAKHGSIGEFLADRENWFAYTDPQPTQHFVANEISDNSNTRRAILLSSCGAPTYQLIRNLVVPGKPTDKSSKLQTQKSSSMVRYRCGGKHKVTDCKF